MINRQDATSVKRSFSSERGGASSAGDAGGNAHLPGFLQLLICQRNRKLRQYARASSSSSRPCADKDQVAPSPGSLDFQSTRTRISHTHTAELLPAENKRLPSVPRSSSVVRRRPDHSDARKESLGGNTPLRSAVVKPLDINSSVRRVQELIRAAPIALGEAGERSPPRFRQPKTSLRRPFHTSPENKHKYHPARHVPVDSVPHTSRPPEVSSIFQPSACTFHAVDLKVLQENSVGKLQREMELRRLAETLYADSRGNSILRKPSRQRDGTENEQPKTVTFCELKE